MSHRLFLGAFGSQSGRLVYTDAKSCCEGKAFDTQEAFDGVVGEESLKEFCMWASCLLCFWVASICNICQGSGFSMAPCRPHAHSAQQAMSGKGGRRLCLGATERAL